MSFAQRYTSTAGETASKERLMVLLFEAGLKNIRLGAKALEEGRWREAYDPLIRASDIVTELLVTLDHSKAPELCQKLDDLYKFVNGRLLQATTSRNAQPAREAERVFAPLVDGFQGAVAKLQSEQAKLAPSP